MKFFSHLQKAAFLFRPNRFVVSVRLGRKKIRAFLPNPGRLSELFFPGSVLYLEESPSPSRKYAHTVVGVERDGIPVMLHTHKANDVAEYLLRQRLVPSFKQAKIIQREYTVGSSRFDFLLEQRGKPILLEVKSCTLFSKNMAMFPDAPSERAVRHVRELAGLSDYGGAVLILVQSPLPSFFLPDYHTDLLFGQTLLEARKKIQIQALGLSWAQDLSLQDGPHPLTIPWKILQREAVDGGAYILLIYLEKKENITLENGEKIHLKKGHYIYVSSAQDHLTTRLARHRRPSKKIRWPVDLLVRMGKLYRDLPFRSPENLAGPISRDLQAFSQAVTTFPLPKEDSLFWMENPPLDSHPFHHLLEQYRMERLV